MRNERLKVWLEISKASPQAELGHVKAGRDAEKRLKKTLDQKLMLSTSSIFSGKRVPFKEGQRTRRYETDLIVLTHKQLSVIEVKEWSGTVSDLGNTWKQVRRNGAIEYHENAKKLNDKKLEKLIDFLKAKNCQVPSVCVSRVVFSNPKLKIEGKILSDPCIVPFDKFKSFAAKHNSISPTERILHAVLDFCLKEEDSRLVSEGLFNSLTTADYQKTATEISTLGNFDLITLYGGRTLQGDVYSLKTQDAQLDLQALKAGTQIDVICHRNKFIALLLAVFGKKRQIRLSAPFDSLNVTPNDFIVFRPVKSTKNVNVPIKTIAKIKKG